MKAKLSSRFLLLSAVLLFSLIVNACAATGQMETVAEQPPVSTLPPLPSASPGPSAVYEDVQVFFDGLLSDKAYIRDGTVYISPQVLCSKHGREINIVYDADSVTVSLPGLEMQAVLGQEYMKANGRYLYSPGGYLIIGDEFFFPSDIIERVFGVNVVLNGDPVRADIDAAELSLIRGGEDYYNTHFSPEDVFWLSHIIYAEAREQPLAGLIGVGNVVLNRIESDHFPGTIFDVIFDRQYTIQFEPIVTGGVYAEPDEMSVIAACLCLEGYNTVGDSLYFVNPDKGDSSWFDSALTHVITIGQHKFFA